MDSLQPTSGNNHSDQADSASAERSRAAGTPSARDEFRAIDPRIMGLGCLLLLTVPVLLLPFDIRLSNWFTGLDFPGDVDKDLQAFQQFGQIASLILVTVLVLRLEPIPIRRSLLDLWLAILIAAGIAVLIKTVFGRVRPGIYHADIAGNFLGPPWVRDTPEFEGNWNIVASMPSNHSTAAAVLAVYLAWIQPRIAVLAGILAGVVAFARVKAGAHFPSDVVAGLLLGALVATLVIRQAWGTRLLDFIWKTIVDRSAKPALPMVREKVIERHLKTTNPIQQLKSRNRIIVGCLVLTLILLAFSAMTLNQPSS